MSATTPSHIHIRAYNVGFGDSFLVTFDYPNPLPDGRSHRHLLIDCGTTKGADGGPTIAETAQLIAQHCKGELDVLVVTHRHKDHLSAFRSNDDILLDTLAPKLIVRPWTDDPTAPIDADAPHALDDGSRRFVSSLRNGQEAAALIDLAFAQHKKDARNLRGELRLFALDQIPNLDVVKHLEAHATKTDVAYVAYGDDTKIATYIPGISVDVLGPPTVAQWPEVTSQRESDPDEFWMLTKRLVDGGLTDAHIDPQNPNRWAVLLDRDGLGPARWLLEQLDDQHAASLLRIVRSFDDALNNTSIILFIEVGDRRMLFSGDAQIENWSYALSDKDVRAVNRERLSRIDLYKVGHHGSRNATPRTLYNLWTADGADDHPMVSLLSTLPGTHGKRAATAVPRGTLVTALRTRTDLYSTDDLLAGEPFIHLSAATIGAERFEPAG